MYKKILDGLLKMPIISGIFVVDLAILSLYKPPFLFSFLMLCYLAAAAAYYGQQIAPFKK